MYKCHAFCISPSGLSSCHILYVSVYFPTFRSQAQMWILIPSLRLLYNQQLLASQPFLSVSSWSLFMPLDRAVSIFSCSVKKGKRVISVFFLRLWLSCVLLCFDSPQNHIVSHVFSFLIIKHVGIDPDKVSASRRECLYEWPFPWPKGPANWGGPRPPISLPGVPLQMQTLRHHWPVSLLLTFGCLG